MGQIISFGDSETGCMFDEIVKCFDFTIGTRVERGGGLVYIGEAGTKLQYEGPFFLGSRISGEFFGRD